MCASPRGTPKGARINRCRETYQRKRGSLCVRVKRQLACLCLMCLRLDLDVDEQRCSAIGGLRIRTWGSGQVPASGLVKPSWYLFIQAFV